MKVAFVAPFPPIRGGIAQHSAQMARAALDAGHDVVLVGWRSQYPKVLYRRPQVDEGTMAFAGVIRVLRWWNPVTWITAGWRLRGMDRLVLPWTVPFHAPHYLVVMAVARVPVSILVHNVLPHEPFPAARLLTRSVLRRADRLVTHAEEVAMVCGDLLAGVEVRVVAHPPDLVVIHRDLPARPPLRLVALGYLRDYKGTDLAIEAVARLVGAGDKVRLTVAGEPWDGDQGQWQRLVSDLGMEDYVDLRLSYQSNRAVAELLADHHALIAPYRSASQSGIVAQALGAGRPVVATRVGGLPDVVHDGVNGVLADPESVDALVEAIRCLDGTLESLAAGAAADHPRWLSVVEALVDRGRDT